MSGILLSLRDAHATRGNQPTTTASKIFKDINATLGGKERRPSQNAPVTKPTNKLGRITAAAAAESAVGRTGLFDSVHVVACGLLCIDTRSSTRLFGPTVLKEQQAAGRSVAGSTLPAKLRLPVDATTTTTTTKFPPINSYIPKVTGIE